MKTRILFLGLVFACLGVPASAEEAITLSGKRVILHDDGTWEYRKSSNEKDVKFRGVPWGCSVEHIKKAIPGKPKAEGSNGLMYEDKIGNLDASCVFVLANGQFVRGLYNFLEKHSNDNLFIYDFNSIDKLLKDKYGEPAQHDKMWCNDLYKNDPEHHGMAISLGYLAISSKWQIGDVTIFHSLMGDNFDIFHQIDYLENTMGKLEDALQKKEDKAKL